MKNRANELEHMATILTIRAAVVSNLETHVRNTLMAYNEDKGEYEPCEIDDKRLSDYERQEIAVYEDIIDAILKLK